MTLSDKKKYGERWVTFFRVSVHILLFSCFFYYFWLFENTRLIYHAFGRFVDYPAFFTGWRFFFDTIDHPGGLADYITGFLSQWYYYPLAGAIVITIVVSLTCLAAAVVLRLAGFRFFTCLIAYIPAVFFLAMHNKGGHPLPYYIPLLINLSALVLYEKIPLKGSISRFVLFSAVFAVLYFISGASAFVFAILTAAYELFIRRSFLLPGLYILMAALIPFGAGGYLNLTPADAYLNHLPFDRGFTLDSRTVPCVLYITVFSVLFAVFVYRYFSGSKPPAKAGGKKTKKSFKAKTVKFGWLLQPAVVVAAGVLTVYLSSGIEKKRIQADFYAGKGMWTELLEYADRNPVVTYDPVGNHNIILALHQTNRLGSELFSYPQFAEAMFLPPRKGEKLRRYLRGIKYINLSLSLGRVNVAEREAYEMLENTGEYPDLLWTLAMINIAKGQPETGRVFLNVLCRDLIHGKKAKSAMKRLKEDPSFSDDKQVSRIRSVMLKKDVTGHQSLPEVMSDLLEVNPHNKLAFEYLMIYYLKSKQVGKIAENIYRLRDFGYKKIPRHFQEAIMLHLGKTGGRLKSHGWKLNPQIAKRANKFMAAVKYNSAGSPAQNLAPAYGDTYFYYYMFE